MSQADDKLRCSFCYKNMEQVRKLIAGGTVFHLRRVRGDLRADARRQGRRVT